jgi:mycoredoxin
MPNIKMYTTTWCGDCRRAKSFLQEKGIPYEEINIEQVEGAAEIVMNVTGGKRQVPTFDIDGKFVTTSPFNRKKLEEALGLKVESTSTGL